MGKNFDLASLIPEQDTFTDTDGTQYPVLSAAHFSPRDQAKLQRLRRDMEQAQTKAATLDENDPDQLEPYVDAIEKAVNDTVSLIIPEMQRDRVEAIKFGFKMQFVQWWQSIQPQPEQIPNAQANAAMRPTRGRRSHASSGSTK